MTRWPVTTVPSHARPTSQPAMTSVSQWWPSQTRRQAHGEHEEGDDRPARQRPGPHVAQPEHEQVGRRSPGRTVALRVCPDGNDGELS